MFILAAMRRAVGSLWLAAPLAVAVFALLGDPATTIEFGQPRLVVMLFVMSIPITIALLRFGLLAGVATAITGNAITNTVFTLDPSRAYFPGSVVHAALIVGIALSGWWLTTARGVRL
jgi:hypothetical protein